MNVLVLEFKFKCMIMFVDLRKSHVNYETTYKIITQFIN